MTRLILLLATALALVLAACGDANTTASPTPLPTPEATPSATATPEPTPTQTETEAPAETDGDGTGSGITGSLADQLPDEVGGFARTDVPGMGELIGPMLQGQGIDADEADFAFAAYGEGDNALVVTAMQMPGFDEAQLEMLARLMTQGQAGGTDVEAETATVGGKEVLRVTPEGQDAVVYVYIIGDAFFSIVGPSPELAEELLSQLP